VSFLRGLFPEGHYRTMPLQNLDGAERPRVFPGNTGLESRRHMNPYLLLPTGMTIRMLTPACAESKRLIDWVETGESAPYMSALQRPAPSMGQA